MTLKDTIKLALSRARYAAIGAAVGAAIGGLFGRSTASTGGATGALVGAIVAEKRHSAGGWLEQIRSEDTDGDAGPTAVLDKAKEKKASISSED